ncbi:sigma-70 family RNA polymerase sigma factor [candidate division WOR-3 bacterium]|nr:sigma-70 family RNA polymerase sigma factor [candidate division WOR-3 bacterium]
MNEDVPDQELVARARAGELDAFEELVRRHQHGLYCFVYRTCGDAASAEEVAQAALVKAWSALAGFRGAASFKTWLYRIGANLAINRRTRGRPTVELDEQLPAPEAGEPETEYRRKQREQAVRQALGRLPADQRTALVLATYEEMSYGEIGETMGKTLRAVDSLLVRARQNLRRLLQPARDTGIV